MISIGSTWRRSLQLAAVFGLGLAALSLPASAAIGATEPDVSPEAANAGQSPGSSFVVADNWNKNNKNWNNNWNNNNNNWNHNNNWNNNDKNWNNNWNNSWNNNNHKHKNKNVYVRTWQPRPYYGQFFGGIVLGSMLTAGMMGVAPLPPAPGLCWYWADPYGYQGYWDYCAPYPPY